MTEPAEPAERATAAPPPTRTSNAILGTLIAIAILSILGFGLAYITALIVVKVGLGGAKLFVGLPLILILGIAWAASVAPRTIGARLAEIAVATALGLGLLLLVPPTRPSRLLEHPVSLVDVEVRDGDAELTFRKDGPRLARMPPVGDLFELCVILAALAVAGSSLVRVIEERRRPKPF